MVRVLFVCMGNICRSPLAEGAFTHLVRQSGLEESIEVDSAGTGNWHAGEPPDPRARAAAQARGIDISGQRARQVTTADFSRFDYVLAMDQDNIRAMSGIAPGSPAATVDLFLNLAPDVAASEVPDPYYGDGDGFEYVLDLVISGSRALLDLIRQRDLS